MALHFFELWQNKIQEIADASLHSGMGTTGLNEAVQAKSC